MNALFERDDDKVNNHGVELHKRYINLPYQTCVPEGWTGNEMALAATAVWLGNVGLLIGLISATAGQMTPAKLVATAGMVAIVGVECAAFFQNAKWSNLEPLFGKK